MDLLNKGMCGNDRKMLIFSHGLNTIEGLSEALRYIFFISDISGGLSRSLSIIILLIQKQLKYAFSFYSLGAHFQMNCNDKMKTAETNTM